MEYKVPPKEMLLLFSIGTFLTNYDVISRKLKHVLIHENNQYATQSRENESRVHFLCTPVYEKEQKWGQSKSMETAP